MHTRIAGNQQGIARAVQTGGKRRDVNSLYPIVLGQKRVVTHDRGEIRHRDDIQAIGKNLAIELSTGWQIQPNDFISDILIFAIMRKILFEKLQFADDRPSRCAINGGILSAYANANGLACLNKCQGKQNKNRC